MKKLLIATNNKGKVKEIQDLLKDISIELVTPNDAGIQLDVEEDGSTYAENAAKKALAFACASGLISLADNWNLKWMRSMERPDFIPIVIYPSRMLLTKIDAHFY